MNKDYLPFYNSLDEKDKTFWLDCSKEELIDHFIANVKNGEVLLHRIDKAIDWCDEIIRTFCEDDKQVVVAYEIKEILGDKENE